MTFNNYRIVCTIASVDFVGKILLTVLKVPKSNKDKLSVCPAVASSTHGQSVPPQPDDCVM